MVTFLYTNCALVWCNNKTYISIMFWNHPVVGCAMESFMISEVNLSANDTDCFMKICPQPLDKYSIYLPNCICSNDWGKIFMKQSVKHLKSLWWLITRFFHFIIAIIMRDNAFTDIWQISSYSASHDNWCTGTLLNRIMTAQWVEMGDVGSARYEPALLPPCPTIRVLSCSNCQRSTYSISKWIFRNLAL